MAKINLDNVVVDSQGKTFEDFAENFQENIQNLNAQNKYATSKGDKDYALDEDGYIVGDVWSEKIASELMDVNGFVSTISRLNALVEGRGVYGKSSLPTDYKVVAEKVGIDAPTFLKMFPKYPIIYFTRWGNMRKPFNLEELINEPVRR
jgi:hypothetical protein